MGEEISRITIVVLLVITVIISLVSTWTVIDSVDSVDSSPASKVIGSQIDHAVHENGAAQKSQSSGKIGLSYGRD